jgi:hypothetical protein
MPAADWARGLRSGPAGDPDAAAAALGFG